MTTTANIIPTAGTDGIPYGTNVPLTSSEADLGDGLKTPDPIAVEYGQIIVAIVQLTFNGLVTANTSYIVMQCDMGDGLWIDVAWCLWTGNQGSATFVLCGGGLGAQNNAFQQTRQAGSPPTPQANGSNVLPLAGRIRFVGKSIFTGGSSSLAGLTTSVSATIKYKLMTPR
jgi:hypothetical protein